MHTIDATNQKLGRVASQAAALLCGKASTDFARNKMPVTKVEITNASKISITETKKKTKTHSRYSGYPSGLKKETLERTIEKKGYSEIIRKAVSGMLPKNKLRSKMLLNLKVSE